MITLQANQAPQTRERTLQKQRSPRCQPYRIRLSAVTAEGNRLCNMHVFTLRFLEMGTDFVSCQQGSAKGAIDAIWFCQLGFSGPASLVSKKNLGPFLNIST